MEGDLGQQGATAYETGNGRPTYTRGDFGLYFTRTDICALSGRENSKCINELKLAGGKMRTVPTPTIHHQLSNRAAL